MPRLTPLLVSQAYRQVGSPSRLVDFLLWYVLGWTDEKTTPAGCALSGGYPDDDRARWYDRGSFDFSLTHAYERGPRNGFTQTGPNDQRRLLISADEDYDSA